MYRSKREVVLLCDLGYNDDEARHLLVPEAGQVVSALTCLRRRCIMNQREIVLACMAPAKGAEHTPVQVQKLFFLIDQNIADRVGGPHFRFSPYSYGPFDKAVYEVLEDLAADGYVDIVRERTWKNYKLSVTGQQEGQRLMDELPEPVRDYIKRLSEFVRALSFTQLVSAIYKAYPEMRANSVFQG
jgi:hypothetical protein